MLNFGDQTQFVGTFALRPNASANHEGCAEPASRPSPTAAAATTTADELIIRVSWRQVMFDKRDKF